MVKENNEKEVYEIDSNQEEKQMIHPILDYTEDSVYILIHLNMKTKSGKRKKQPFFITNKGLIDARNLNRMGVELIRALPHEVKFLPKFNLSSVVSVESEANTGGGGGHPIHDKKDKTPLNKQVYNTNYTTTPYIYIYTLLTTQSTLLHLKKTIDKYMELQDIDDKTIISLWMLGTYLFPLFNSFPYFYVQGLKNTGKSKLITLFSLCSFNGLNAGSITSSALFRVIDIYRPTLCLDEAEFLSNPKNVSEINYLLLNGYKKGAEAIRSMQQSEKGGDYKPLSFYLYSPKVIANIGGIDDVIESRCISINLTRAITSRGDLYPEDNNEFKELRTQLLLFCINNWMKIKKLYDTMINDTALNNRDYEIWKPILSIAKLFGDETYNSVLRYSYKKTKEKMEDDVVERVEFLLLKTLNEICQETKYISISTIVAELKSRFDDVEWVNNRNAGRMLKRLGIKEKRRISRGIEYLIVKEKIDDLIDRFKVMDVQEKKEDDMFKRDSKSKECKKCGLTTEFLSKDNYCELCIGNEGVIKE